MKNSLKAWVFALCVLETVAGNDAFASPRVDARYDFGRIPFGAEVTRLPSWAIGENCTRAMSGFNDCSFRDANAVKYGIIDAAVRDKVMVVTGNNAAKLPYGIDPRKSQAQILRDVSKRLGLTFTDAGGGNYWSDYLQPDDYDGLAIVLHFNTKGRLLSVELWSNAT